MKLYRVIRLRWFAARMRRRGVARCGYQDLPRCTRKLTVTDFAREGLRITLVPKEKA